MEYGDYAFLKLMQRRGLHWNGLIKLENISIKNITFIWNLKNARYNYNVENCIFRSPQGEELHNLLQS